MVCSFGKLNIHDSDVPKIPTGANAKQGQVVRKPVNVNPGLTLTKALRFVF